MPLAKFAASSSRLPRSVPGISITEHLPRLAKLADQYAIIRSVNHRDNDHAIGTYLALTGYSHPKHEILGIEPPATPQDLPAVGSVVSKLRPAQKPVFSVCHARRPAPLRQPRQHGPERRLPRQAVRSLLRSVCSASQRLARYSAASQR